MNSFKIQDSNHHLILENLITVKGAAEATGYNVQYLRRLLRLGKLEGVQVGQVWLIKLNSFESYLSQNENRGDRRCGPRSTCIQL